MGFSLAGIIGAFGYGREAQEPVRHTASSGGSSFKQTLAETEKSTGAAMSAAEKFLTYQKMTAAEKFRASYLAEKGLSEEDLAAMSPEDRLKIEEEIITRLREKLAESANRKINGDA